MIHKFLTTCIFLLSFCISLNASNILLNDPVIMEQLKKNVSLNNSSKSKGETNLDFQKVSAIQQNDEVQNKTIVLKQNEFVSFNKNQNISQIIPFLSLLSKRELIDIYILNKDTVGSNLLEIDNQDLVKLSSEDLVKVILEQYKNFSQDSLYKIYEVLSKPYFSYDDYKKTFDSPIKSFNNFTPFSYKDQIEIFDDLVGRQIQVDTQKELSRFGINFFQQTSNEPLSFVSPPDFYLLSSGDSLNISIYGVENINLDLTIDKEGNLNIPKVGNIQLSGLSYERARQLMHDKLLTLYPNSTILISLGTLRSVSITVAGDVNRPGNFNLPALSKVKDALLYANGISDTGSMRGIEIKRDGKTVAKFDLYNLIKYGNDNGDIVLRSGDIIFVPVAKKLISLEGNVKNEAIYELNTNETLLDLIEYSGGLKSDTITTAKIQRSINNQKALIEVGVTTKTQLQDGDKVYIGQIANVLANEVTILGNVYRNENYEISQGETIKSLIERLIKIYGKENIFMPSTDMSYYAIKRINPITLEEESYSGNLQKALEDDKGSNILLQSRDRIYFFNKNMISEIEYITVEGEVLRGGKLRYFKGMKLVDALNSAGIKKESDLEKIRVISMDNEKKKSVNFYSFEQSNEVILSVFDEISVSNFFTTREQPIVTIKGAVNDAGVFPYTQNLKLSDLINYSKGLKHSARVDQFELVRYINENNIRKPIVKKISLDEALKEDILLEPYDEVLIQEIKGWDENRVVVLSGEVMFPGSYVISPGERLSSVIQRAGGFTSEAFVKGAVFTREDVKKIQKEALDRQVKELENSIIFYATRGEEAGANSSDKSNLLRYMETIKAQAKDVEMVGRVAINIDTNISKFVNTDYDVVLKAGDKLHIPPHEDSVMVLGEVMSQTALSYQAKADVLDYINKAGGLKQSADDKGIFVIKANGESKKVGYSNIFGMSSVKIEKGDVIVVPFNVSQFSGMKFAKDLTSIIYQIAVSAAALKTLGAL